MAEAEDILTGKPAPKLKLNKKVQVVLVCLFFSIICWFLIALSKEYVAHIKFKLRYEEVPVNHVIVNTLPATMKLAVKTSGFRVLSYRFDINSEPVIIDVNSKLPAVDQVPNEVALPARALAGDFSPHLGDEFQILSYAPDTIFFSFRKKSEKRVPVHLVSDIRFSKQFDNVSTAVITPDSVTVSGPAEQMKALKYVETEPLKITNAKETVHKKVSLAIDKGLIADVKEIEVLIKVDKFVEGTVVVPLRTAHVKERFTMKLSQPNVKVNFLVARADKNQTSASLFDAVVEPDTKDKGRAKVNLIKKPQYIHSVTLDPEYVEYTLVRK
jgi:YbbR domain-containing protein